MIYSCKHCRHTFSRKYNLERHHKTSKSCNTLRLQQETTESKLIDLVKYVIDRPNNVTLTDQSQTITNIVIDQSQKVDILSI